MTERSVTHGSFHIERTFDASPARVFAAWSEPEARFRWFVSGEGFEVGDYRHDFRVGGHEHSRFRSQERNSTFTNDTWYQDIVPDERIVFTYVMDEDSRRFSVSLSTVEFRAGGDGTKLLFTEQAVFLEGADGPDMRKEGWTYLFEQLAKEVAREAETAR